MLYMNTVIFDVNRPYPLLPGFWRQLGFLDTYRTYTSAAARSLSIAQ